MVDENENFENEEVNECFDAEIIEQESSKNAMGASDNTRNISGMYNRWFLEYASYVNLDRAIPHISDGLKPVQRRVLHAMKKLDDGRYNKVANIVGYTMQFHPHGDSSIAGALVNIGQKNVLVDCQGNWGNILTGDRAAASRYIEARLTPFAIEAIFNPKTTDWKASYDGRNKEPIALPVKFPLLLLHGAEGVGVGLKSDIFPHNFGELCDASISYLRNEEFELYPDFPTGGMLDVSKYNDGERGGKLVIRAKVEKVDNKMLKIVETPYRVTSEALMESIVEANEKGKINVKKIEDNTSKKIEILVHLAPQTSSDKTIDALYAFTDCQVKESPICCVVDDNKPRFISVSEVLRRSADSTVRLLNMELEIERAELSEKLFFSSLEKIFIEQGIYKDKEFEQASTTDVALEHIDKRLEAYKDKFIREVVREDLQRLLEIKMARILKFNSDKAEEVIAQLKSNIKDVNYKIDHIVDHAIEWFAQLKKKYAHLYPRQTELRNFEVIQAAKVVEANEKLYVNKAEGFIGYALKKDENVEMVSSCSSIDDVIVFFKDGKYKVVRIVEKLYVGKNIIHVAVFQKNDKRTIYNAVYRNGKAGDYYIKRFAVTAITRDKENDLTQGEPGTKVVYFTANPNGEAETIKVALKQTSRRIKNLQFEKSFSDIAIKGRQSMGNILTKFDIHKIILKQRGTSTLGGSDIWFDEDVLRLNVDERGRYLGNFDGGDQILVITQNGEYYTTSFELTNHYGNDILKIEKFDVAKVWSLVLYDGEQKFHYVKRFQFENSAKRMSFLNGMNCSILWLSDAKRPIVNVVFGGADSFRGSMEVYVEDFIGIKGYKAKGKRLSTYMVERIVDVTSEEEDVTNDGAGDSFGEALSGSAVEVFVGDDSTVEAKENIVDNVDGASRKSVNEVDVVEIKADASNNGKDESAVSNSNGGIDEVVMKMPEAVVGSTALEGVEIVSRNTLDKDDAEPSVDEMTGQMSLF